MPARGVERWLTQRLSHRLGVGRALGDGVCAGVDFVTPHSLVSMLLGKDSDDPWEPDRLAWPLLEVIDDVPGRDRLRDAQPAPRPRRIAGAERKARRYAVARRLAGLFASYAVQRPALVTDWREGRDTDGAGRSARSRPALAGRAVAAAAGPRGHHAARRPARRRPWSVSGPGAPTSTCRRGCPSSATPDCPSPRSRCCGALGDAPRRAPLAAAGRPPTLWATLAPTAPAGPVPRTADDVGRPRRTPAARLARPGLPRAAPRARRGSRERSVRPLPCPTRCSAGSSTTCAPTPPPTPTCAPGARPVDRSVQVHACHGAARQVDVLREVLVGLLQDDPTLEPRDILVMCPDIESYAPLISAGFGLADVAGRRRRPPGPPAAGPARRPVARCHQPAARGRRRARRARGRPRSPPPRCSTWPAPTRCAPASGGATTTSSGSATGSPSPASAGATTRRTAAPSASRSTPTPGGSGCAGCCSARRCPGRDTASSAARCRSTTWVTATSSWPVGSPSWSSGCTPSPPAPSGRRPSRSGPRRSPRRCTR